MRLSATWFWQAVLAVLWCSACGEKDPKAKLGFSVNEHQVEFPIAAGASHAIGTPAFGGPLSCNSCHGGTNTFKEFKCIECHTHDERALTSVHAGIAGFLQVNSACLECHPDGKRGANLGVDAHSNNFFPIRTTDAHGGPLYVARISGPKDQCTSCHLDVEDRTIVACADCHALDTAPTLELGHQALPRSFVRDSVACRECHGETPINPAMHPLDNHGFYDPDHHEATCKDCHYLYQEEPRQWTLEFGASSCSQCHLHTHPPDCNPAAPGKCT